MNTAIALANAYPNIVQGVVVGNEWSDRDFAPGPVTVAQIIADLQYVRGKITNPNIFVTTCLGFYAALNPQKDQWGRTDPRYQAGKDYGVQVAPYCDVMMFTAYPFYAGYDISIAYSNTKYWYDYAVNLFPGKQVFFGELGWPSAGPNQPLQLQGPPVPPNPAVTSVANEQTYITQLLNNQQNADKLGPIFLFEAFDEPWKGGSNPLQEPYWGLWTKDNAPKFDFTVPTLPQAGAPPLQAKMDINPFTPNFINTNARVFDLVPVAVLATKDFDPQTLDINTIRFGALGAEAPVMHSFVSYANFDRKRDLMLYFRISETGIQSGDDSAYLTARDKNGNLVVGSDNVRTFGSNFLPLRRLR